MTAAKCFMADVQCLVKFNPELFFVRVGFEGNVGEIYCYNALVETSPVFVFVWIEVKGVCNIAFGFCKSVGSKETSAAHAAVYVAFVFQHDLGGNIVRNHAFCCTFCCKLGQIEKLAVFVDVAFCGYIKKLRKRRGNEYPFSVRQTFNSLIQYFFDEKRKVVLRLDRKSVV